MPSITLPYRDAFRQGARPYLVLHVTGPRGKNAPIVGLIDSGADTTCLPFGFATLMGYEASELRQQQGQQAGGAMDLWVATVPSSAYVVGLPGTVLDMHPSFVHGSQTPLWGRADFFRAFGVSFDETGQTFTLSPV